MEGLSFLYRGLCLVFYHPKEKIKKRLVGQVGPLHSCQVGVDRTSSAKMNE